MQEIQLYIGSERVELFKDETISLTETIQNVRDVAKVFTDFTKTFTIPASKKNNKIFKHYYNYDIINGFDARLKTSGRIELNGINFKKGNIKLEGVDLKNNSPNSYKVTFFGELSDLKDIIGEDLLSDLSWLDNFQKEYSSANVKDNLKGNNTNFTVDGTTYTGVIKTPLISCINRLYYNSGVHSHDDDGSGNLFYNAGNHEHGVYWKDLKYSIAVYIIVKAIEEKYSITFSDDFFNQSNAEYGELLMLMHRKKGEAEAEYSTGVQLYSIFISNINTNAGAIASGSQGGNFYSINPNSDGFTTMGDYEIGGGTNQVSYSYSIDINPDDNNIPYNAYLYFTDTATGVQTLLDSVEGETGGNTFSEQVGVTRVGKYTVKLEAAETLSFGVGDIEIDGDIFYWTGSSYINIGNCGLCFARSNTVANIIEERFPWLPTQQLPKMRVLDFLTGIWKLFNLTAYVEDDGVIKVQKLDDFYSNSNSYDISKYIDVNSSSVNTALPYKQINFDYKGNKTLLASKFDQLQNRQFSKLKYKGYNPQNWVGKEYNVQVPFEKMVYERLNDQDTLQQRNIMYGFFADDNQEPTIGEPLLHYATLQNPTTMSFRDTTTTHSNITTSVFMPSNQVNFQNNSQQPSINFYAENNEWNNETNYNSLFNDCYRTYIQDIFNENRRITKVKAFLPLKIILNHTLADKFVIVNKKYNINSITTNLQTGESDIELLNVIIDGGQVLPSIPAPTNLRVVYATSTTIVIAWDLPAEPMSYIGIKLNSVEYVETNGLNTSYILSGLQNNTSYSIKVYSINFNDDRSLDTPSIIYTT
jgi:hypothetical protein